MAASRLASSFLCVVALCGAASQAQAEGLGVRDVGIFDDLTAGVALSLPPDLVKERARLELRVDLSHQLAVLYQGEDALKVFPHSAQALRLQASTFAAVVEQLGLRSADRLELALLLGKEGRVSIVSGRGRSKGGKGDRDGDGIPDTLDVLIGARKLVANQAGYIEKYRTLSYPGGDVPRDEGVCTDTVVRALRNAGLDLQQAVSDDIRSTPRAYRMVKRPNRNIDHRRVKTLLPYFQRHLREVPAAQPYLPGDVVFFDTFPSKAGPDHIGIVSDRRADSGLPLVVNNWTTGSTDAEMDLLGSIPVTHRFRLEAP